MMARRILIICLLLWAGTLHAQERRATNSIRDSLLAGLEDLPHDESRLETLFNLSKASQNDLAMCSLLTEQLLQEAKYQKNDHYLCEAHFSQILIAYNSYDAQGVQAAFEKLAPVARKIKNFDLLFRGWRCSIDFMILSQDFERNEQEAQQMLNEAEQLDNMVGVLEAYQCLANLYRITFRNKHAAELLEKALPIAHKLGIVSTITNTWQPLLFLYEDMRDFPNWKQTMQDLNTYLHNLSPQEFGSQEPLLLILYGSYINYHTLLGELPQAVPYLRLAQPLYESIQSPLYKIYYDRSRARYYSSTGQGLEALTHLREARRMMEEISLGVDYHALLRNEADLLYSLGHAKEARPIYKKVRQFEDSLQIATINKQYEQLRKNFNTETLLFEQARLQHQVRLYTLGMLALGLLVIAGFFIYLLRSNRSLRKAEHDMREMTRHMELANEAKDRFLSNIGSTISEPLNTIVGGSLRLATQEINDAEHRQQLSAKIRCMSSSLLRVINDILDLSRLEAGMMKYQITHVEVTVMLLDAASVSTALHGVDIRSKIPEGRLYLVRADGTRLLQVLTSLFDHAAEGLDRIVMIVRIENDKLHLRIEGSALAIENTSQETMIRNEINRMLIVHFGGSYEIQPDTTSETICVTLPIAETILSDSETAEQRK